MLDAVNGVRHTDENVANARLPCSFVRQPAFVRLEACEADGHFRDNARQDRAEPLVQRKWRFALHDSDASRDDTARLRLPPFLVYGLRSERAGYIPRVRCLTWRAASAP